MGLVRRHDHVRLAIVTRTAIGHHAGVADRAGIRMESDPADHGAVMTRVLMDDKLQAGGRNGPTQAPTRKPLTPVAELTTSLASAAGWSMMTARVR